MTGLPKFFRQTSDKPYDRHNYRYYYKDNTSIVLDSYEEVMEKWFNTPSILKSHIEVLDKKKKTTKGFK